MKSGKPSQAATESHARGVNTGALPDNGRKPAVSGGPHDFASQHACIDSGDALPGSTVTRFIPVKSMTRPFDVTKPIELWPPLRTAISSPPLVANSGRGCFSHKLANVVATREARGQGTCPN